MKNTNIDSTTAGPNERLLAKKVVSVGKNNNCSYDQEMNN
jgi:hypothetical protein